MSTVIGTIFDDNNTVNGEPPIFRPALMGDINGVPENDEIFGRAGNDILDGKRGNDRLFGEEGNDTLIGGPGNDLLDGGDGGDTADYTTASAAVTVNLTTGRATGGAGNDTLVRIEGVLGSRFGDTLAGGAGGDVLSGGDGDDSIDGRAGNDLVSGGRGNDTLTGGEAPDNTDVDTASYVSAAGPVNVDLAAGTATGGDGNDSLIGIEGVEGSGFNDTLLGDANGNQFTGRAGNDFIDGRGNFDSVIYISAPSAVTVNLRTGRVSGGAGNDHIVNIEGIIGSEFNDSLAGNAGDNRIVGAGGNDIINGGAGNDSFLTGDAGNDTLIGSTGSDFFNGGDDTDTADYSNLGRAITLLPQGFVDKGSLGQDFLFKVERVIGATGRANTINASGATGATSITVDLSANSLIVNNVPGVGNLSLFVQNFVNVTGTANGDNITGNGANNTLSGLGGADILFGGTGNDTLNGGVGSDSLTGSIGADIFAFDFKNFQPPEGIDDITDFSSKEGDIIRIISSEGTPTLDRFSFDSATGSLFFDQTLFTTLQPGSGFNINNDLLIT